MIPHNRPTVGKDEAMAAAKVVNSANLAQGKEVRAFEDEMCAFLGIEPGHAVAVSSGTAALYLAIRALDAEETVSDIAIPAYSCSALRNAVYMANKTPVYLDCEENSPNVDLSKASESVSLTIFCHMYGIPQIIEQKNVIEDCAQSIGARIQNAYIGTQTNISIFSFYATKPITSGGEGGMVVSNDGAIVEYIRDIRDFDMKNDEILRFNLKMTDLQAAVGRVQLKRLPEFIKKRKYLADRYEDSGIPLLRREGSNEYRAIIKSANPHKLVNYLYQKSICAILPIEDKELLCPGELVPMAHLLTNTLVSIPLYPSLKEEQQDRIIESMMAYCDMEGEL